MILSNPHFKHSKYQVFSNKADLLDLYNALNEKNYSIDEIAESLEQPLETIQLLIEKLQTRKTD